MHIKTLIIDNYDSFTYNLLHIIGSLTKEEPHVITHDQYAFNEINFTMFDNIIISPGPGNPLRKKDFGICKEVIMKVDLPIFGICLGHQGIGSAFGAMITKAPTIVHGESSMITHMESKLFSRIPLRFNAIRYHSLIIDKKDFPSCLKINAMSENVIMGIEHREKPLFGVQFHPESIGSEYGKQLFMNFNTITTRYHRYGISK